MVDVGEADDCDPLPRLKVDRAVSLKLNLEVRDVGESAGNGVGRTPGAVFSYRMLGGVAFRFSLDVFAAPTAFLSSRGWRDSLEARVGSFLIASTGDCGCDRLSRPREFLFEFLLGGSGGIDETEAVDPCLERVLVDDGGYGVLSFCSVAVCLSSCVSRHNVSVAFELWSLSARLSGLITPFSLDALSAPRSLADIFASRVAGGPVLI